MVSIVVTCHGEAKDLPIILGCIEQQREYGPGKHSRTGADFLYAAGGMCEYPREIIIVSDGPYLGSPLQGDVNLVECPKGGPPGQRTREPGIMAAKGEWVILSNSDNYFVGGWLSAIRSHLINPKVGLVYWDIVSNLWAWSTGGGSKLKRGHIDLSCAAVRSEIAKKIGFPVKTYEGDFDYLSKCAELCSKRGLKIVKVSEILGVHC